VGLREQVRCAGIPAQRALIERFRDSPHPIAIFGTGIYAYVLVRYLALQGVHPRFALVDRELKTVDSLVDLPVVTMEDLGDRIRTFEVVIGITNYPAVEGRLRACGAIGVHVVDVPDYLNMPEPFMDIDYFEANVDKFEAAYGSFADELSRQTYAASINAKLNEDARILQPVVRRDRLYFPSAEFPIGDHEAFLDVGGFDGDTVLDFHAASGGRYDAIVSLEPCLGNYERLVRRVEDARLDRVIPVRRGAWDRRETLHVAPQQMAIDNQIAAGGSEAIEVDRIDAILRELQRPVTLIKLDINGAEYPALRGAEDTIRVQRPKIAVRLHCREDYFRIPLLLKDLAPDMRLLLRQRCFMSVMVILYLI
jgi:FkbM family methyltransferase